MDFVNRVHPDLRGALRQMAEFRLKDDLRGARNQPKPPFRPSERVAIRDIHIPGGDGQNMWVRLYEPVRREEDASPALLWIHGGGYVLGDPLFDDNLCQIFVETAGCVVFSPDYRLAPEHPFPAGLEDCYAVLKWIDASADTFRIDRNRVAVAGASAGGGLTAALSLMARDRGGPSICFQMPLYPMIDDRNRTPSSHEITYPKGWSRQNNLDAWSMYLGGDPDDVSPYAAPIRADNLAGLPPTYTCIGQLDVFRDETIEYVTRLAQAGVDVEFHLYPGCFHGFEIAAWDADISVRARNDYVRAWRKRCGAAAECPFIRVSFPLKGRVSSPLKGGPSPQNGGRSPFVCPGSFSPGSVTALPCPSKAAYCAVFRRFHSFSRLCSDFFLDFRT